MNKGMNDDRRKLLTKYLGECWHEWESYFLWDTCKLCGRPKEDYPNRTFDNWDDLGALKERMVEKGEWDSFVQWTDNKVDSSSLVYYIEDFANWLLDPERCEDVAEWLEGRG